MLGELVCQAETVNSIQVADEMFVAADGAHVGAAIAFITSPGSASMWIVCVVLSATWLLLSLLQAGSPHLYGSTPPPEQNGTLRANLDPVKLPEKHRPVVTVPVSS